MIAIIGNWILTTSWTVKHFGVRVDIINKDKCRLHIIGPLPNFSVVYYFSKHFHWKITFLTVPI